MDSSWINKKILESLIKSGSFDEFGDRGSLFDSVERILIKINEELNEAKERYDSEIKLTYEKNKNIFDKKINELNYEFDEKKKKLENELLISKDKVLQNISKISLPTKVTFCLINLPEEELI